MTRVYAPPCRCLLRVLLRVRPGGGQPVLLVNKSTWVVRRIFNFTVRLSMFYLDYAIVPMYLMFLCLYLNFNMFRRCHIYHATFITLYFYRRGYLSYYIR